MATPSADPGAFGISPEDWRDADSYTDLASVYEELGRVDILDRVVVRHLQCSEAIKGTQAPQPSPLSSQDSSSTSEYRWRDAAICIDRRREALRSRAAFLSRGETRDIQLMDLSVELLAMITNQFRYSASLDQTAEEDFIGPFSRSDLQTVQSLRLVSRLFNSLSSPLLYPIVRLSLSQKSLDRVQAVCSNHLIASGVRAIHVGLEYHPAELVRDLNGWLHYNIDRLNMKRRRLSSLLAQNAFRRKVAAEAGNVERAKHFHEAMEDIRQAMDRSRVVRFAMRQMMSSGTELVPDKSDEERVSRYRVLVRHCHDEFSRAYEEQVRLLLDKSFVSSVARLALHASHPVALELIASEFRCPKRVKNGYLASGVSWDHEGDADNDEQQQQAIRIIHDLPVAIHQAGGVINAFKLGCPPMAHHLRFMEGLTDRDWGLLNAAFQQLKIFHMPNLSFSYPSRLLLLSEEQKVNFGAYFSALIAHQNLEEVSIDGQIYLGFNASGSIEHGGIWGVLEGIIGRAYWPRIKRIKFSSFSTAQAHMEGLFQGLGTRINKITLKNIHLGSGSWIPAIDILHERMKQALGSGSLNECSVHLQALSGVEMGRLETEAVGPVMEALKCYILGKGSSGNPLLKYALS
ncbi:unnamed protein product [Clonostachys chloroleuca]|uniref:Uncharacterized protein n=1 Tax=Clonostachys chloroleuca TaxID=1926264 RepID=A0AA35M391_9HYPO|nr:unnamed protein product [Clonostachys chloroleuca]